MTDGEQAIVNLLEEQKRARRRALLLKVLGITVGGAAAAYYGPKALKSVAPIVNGLATVPKTMKETNRQLDNMNWNVKNNTNSAYNLARKLDPTDEVR